MDAAVDPYSVTLVCLGYICVCVCGDAWIHEAQVLVVALVKVTRLHEGEVLVVALRLYK